MARRAATPDPPSPTRHNTRKSARLGSQPVSSAASTPQRSKRARGRPRKPLPEEQLQPLEEAAQEDSSDDGEIFQDAPNIPIQLATPGNQSNLSGATAVSASNSLNEINDLRANLASMLDRLPDLNDDSSRILRQLASHDSTLTKVSELATQLQAQNSSASARLKISETAFADSFETFAGSAHYVRPDLVLRALFDPSQDIHAGQWRPDEILYKANLAKMIILIMTSQQESDSTQAVLEHLDSSFANLFFSSIGSDTSAPGSTNLLEAAFDAALALRTQLAIVSAQSVSPDEDLDLVVRNVFVHPEEEMLSNDESRMKGWGVRAFETRSAHLRGSFQSRAYEAYQTVYEVLTLDSPIELGSAISWSGFQFHMVSWAARRTLELNTRIADRGGADSINTMLRAEIEKPANKREATAPRRNVDRHGQAIGKLAKRITGGSRILKDPLLEPPASDPAPIAREQAPRSERGAQTLPRSGRSLIDRQPTAQRLSFEDSQPSQSVVVIDGSGDARRPNTTDLDEPVSQDQGFGMSTVGLSGSQRNVQGQSKSRQKANPTPTKAKQSAKRTQGDTNLQPQAKRVRTTHSQRDDHSGDEDGDEEARRPRQQRPERIAPPSSNWVPPASNYPQTNQAARWFVASRKQGVQQRLPWSTVETDTLREYIIRYGTKWSFIKEIDQNVQSEADEHGDPILLGPNILHRRDQVALKDKARNMKMDYLKAGDELPRNFDAVALKAVDKEKLRQRGIDPDG